MNGEKQLYFYDDALFRKYFKWLMSVKRSLLIALAINLFFLVLCVLFGDLRFGAIDDYFMAAVLTGAHGDSYNPLIVFVNALYAYALLLLYHLFPSVGLVLSRINGECLFFFFNNHIYYTRGSRSSLRVSPFRFICCSLCL
jgi:hypothetical protein